MDFDSSYKTITVILNTKHLDYTRNWGSFGNAETFKDYSFEKP